MGSIILSVLLGAFLMLLGTFNPKQNFIRIIVPIALSSLAILNILEFNGLDIMKSIDLKDHLVFVRSGNFLNVTITLSTLIYYLLSSYHIEQLGDDIAEFSSLLFFILCGAFILTSFNNLLMFFLGIEILSIPLYIFASADKKNLKSNEAALKYFLMGAFTTGIMLMGIALVYGATGSFGLSSTSVKSSVSGLMNAGILAPLGLVFIFVSMLFKVSAAPFHFWTPDVYDGSPSVFTSFMATIVKSVCFYAFIKLFAFKSIDLGPSWKLMTGLVVFATLFIGNVTAVFQQSVKRLLSYSSISQAGFMLFALFSNNALAIEGLIIYTIAYSFATIGVFSILMKMDDISIQGYNGLSKSNPLLAFANTIFLLSLAGFPFTIGFFGKYYMLMSAIQSGCPMFLLISAILFAAIGIYYYFKIIQAMYFKEGDAKTNIEISAQFKYGVLLLSLAVIFFGLFPSSIIEKFYF